NRKRFQPAQPLVANSRPHRRNHLSQPSKQQGEFGMRCGHFRQPLSRPERLISIAENSGPAECAYFVDYFARMRSTEHQIAPVYKPPPPTSPLALRNPPATHVGPRECR